MTTVSNVNNVSPALLGAVNGTANATAAAAGSTEATQDRFLKLLVAQMKNQDPLNPMDNAQVTSQMAQLSTVTGIEKLNTTLETMMASNQTAQSLQAANMIGHGVLTPGSALTLHDGTALMGVELTQPADNVTVTVVDAAGNTVRKLDLGSREVGSFPVAWDGKNDAGNAADDGKYKFEITATLGGQKISATALQFGMVNTVSTGAQGLRLDVAGIGSVTLPDVRQIL